MSLPRTTVQDCRLVDLRRIVTRQGSITPVEGASDIPFDIARVYYLYDVPGGQSRGGHAHFDLEQIIVAAMGSFDVVLDDGFERRTVRLNRAYSGLYLPRLIWRELHDFSSGGICLVLASRLYDEADYILDLERFRSLKAGT